jgi:hypothetical protein
MRKATMKEPSSVRMNCPICHNFKSNPQGIAIHMNTVHRGRQRITNMVSRHMDRFNKKKRLGLVFPIDTTRSGVFPEPVTESLSDSDQLKFMMERLLDMRRARLPVVMAGIRSAYKRRRLAGKHEKYWKRYYDELEKI